MFRTRIALVLAAVALMGCLIVPAAGAEVDCGSVYCFSAEDFSGTEEIAGICITDLPQEMAGTLALGSRILRPGDILTAEQVGKMTFTPVPGEEDRELQVGYLPIYENSVGPDTALTLSIRGREDKPPVAEDCAVETYKNLSVTGKLKVSDPEGQPMTFTVTRQPKRGTVELGADGSFTYTPKKNKVGVDSFVFTATDPAGKVSREATVTVTILKATDGTQYTDTKGLSCQFAAEWMKNTGIFVGERLDGNACFQPEKTVTRGEFTAMLVKTLELPKEEVTLTGYTDDIPQWLRPYVAAAVRSGLTAGLPDQETFGAEKPITGAEAAVMVQNALGLKAAGEEKEEVPAWAEYALRAVEEAGLTLDAEAPLTRAQAAELMYQVSGRITEPTRYYS
ncbi:MAG: Ig-like domain-containing protein [Candidatus Faecousia sp.]|nr:Ig-like domain-containing protein [Clostridiales bacterium]MDY6181681.1 Ig-like domain-containing protein [Candidatus Faecousia sp.]